VRGWSCPSHSASRRSQRSPSMSWLAIHAYSVYLRMPCWWLMDPIVLFLQIRRYAFWLIQSQHPNMFSFSWTYIALTRGNTNKHSWLEMRWLVRSIQTYVHTYLWRSHFCSYVVCCDASHSSWSRGSQGTGTRVEKNGSRREAEKKNFKLDCGSERTSKWVRYVRLQVIAISCRYTEVRIWKRW
jgi:hypothetical protein